MLFNATDVTSFWVYALSSATYIINSPPLKILAQTTLFEMLFHSPLNYDFFGAFGYRVFPYLRNCSANKLALTTPHVFLSDIVLITRAIVV